ncbi:F-box/WD repeat-containing protein 2-like isoform X1 [Clavelina lepadiformis]|uniref:F-box/WD repeat-containing protein 2-like isoform X1 n=1 Tax=Clavelina lepadiformis TaxID=159417 RepID=UPI0040434729
MNQEQFALWCDRLETNFKFLSGDQKIGTVKLLLSCLDIPELQFLSTQSDLLLKRDFVRFLPSEISEKILLHLNPFTLLKCCSVSKTWNKCISSSNTIWRRACLNAGWNMKENPIYGNSWKDTFRTATNYVFKLKSGCYFQQTVLKHFTSQPTLLRFHKSKQLLVAGSEGGEVSMWSTRSKELLYTINTHSVADVLFGYDYIYTASFDATIACWDWRTGALMKEYRGHVGAVYSISSDLEHDLLLSGSADTSSIIWQLSTATMLNVYNGHEEWVLKVLLQKSDVHSLHHKPDDLVVMTMGKGSIKLWPLDKQEVLETLKPPSGTSPLKPNLNFNGRCILCSTESETLEWNFKDLTLTRIFKHSSSQQYCLAIGSRLALMSDITKKSLLIERISHHHTTPSFYRTDDKEQTQTTKIHRSQLSMLIAYQLPRFTWYRQGSNFAVGPISWLDGFTEDLQMDLVCACVSSDHSVSLLTIQNKQEWR